MDAHEILTSGWGTSEAEPKCVTNWWYPPSHPLACICEAETEEAAEHIAQALNSNATVDALREALERMVYETTSLSPLEDDGSHWCRISAEALAIARAALAKIAKETRG